MRTKEFLALLTCFACLQFSVAGPALAQEEGPGLLLEEVIVTATRRETTLQETPAAISAFLEEALEDMGAIGFEDYARFVPGLSFTDLGPSRKKYTIRGVQTEIGAGDSASTVAQYLDEVPLTAFGVNQPDPNLYDVQRVEVLRGPQGTLFGSSAMGGAVRTIMNKPDLVEAGWHGEGRVSTTDGGGTGYLINLMANTPLVDDRFAMRFVISSEQQDGFIDNTRTGQSDVNEGDRLTGRIMALYQPNDVFELSAFYLAQRSSLDGAWRTDPTAGEYVQRTALLEPYQDDMDIVNLTANLEMAGGTLTAIASHFDRDDSQDQIDQEYGYAFGFIGPLGAGAFADGDRDSSGEAYELRYTSNWDGKFNLVAGAFYNRTNETSVQNLYDVNGLTQAMFPEAPAGPNDPVFEEVIDREFTDKSIYANLSIALGERWTAMVGARWFDEEYVFTDTVTVPPTYLGFPADPPPAILSSSSSDVSPKFNLAWQVSDDVMLYLDASEGFRRGGTNIANTFRAFVPEAYGPDSLWSYELGMNSQWADGRVILNASAYHTDWSDAQLKTLLSGDNGFGGTAFAFGVVNVGDVTIDGLEIELSALASENLEVGGSLGLINAELADNAPGSDPFRGLKGDAMPGVPDVEASIYAQYTRPLSNGWELFLRGDANYVDSRSTELRQYGVDPDGNINPANPNPNYFVMDDYTIANLRIGARTDRWQAYLFANNLFNEDADMLFYLPFGQTEAGVQKIPLRPLTIGVTLRLNY